MYRLFSYTHNLHKELSKEHFHMHFQGHFHAQHQEFRPSLFIGMHKKNRSVLSSNLTDEARTFSEAT